MNEVTQRSLEATPGPRARTPEWYALRKDDPGRDRRVVFGATEAAVACGESPYATPLDMYLEKIGEGFEREETEAMMIGRALEGGVCEIYQFKTGKSLLRDLPMYFHPTLSFMAATPDAFAFDNKSVVKDSDDTFREWEDGSRVVSPAEGVDAKTSTFRRYDEFGLDDSKFGVEGTDQLPVDYVMQAQQQCAVLGLAVVAFPVLFDGSHVRLYRVERNDDLIDAIVDAEEEMYQRIINRDPPEPNFTHSNVRNALRNLHGLTAGKVALLLKEDMDMWVRYKTLGEQVKELNEDRAVLAAKLLHTMCDAELGRFPLGTKEIRRVVVRESKWSNSDLQEVREKIGTRKRKSYERLIERKVK